MLNPGTHTNSMLPVCVAHGWPGVGISVVMTSGGTRGTVGPAGSAFLAGKGAGADSLMGAGSGLGRFMTSTVM